MDETPTRTEAPAEPDRPATKPRRGFFWTLKVLVLAIVAVVGAYYLGGAFWINNIDDDPAFGAAVAVPEKGSHVVAVAAALVEREVDKHRWVANDPPFMPAYILDNMPNFQTGILAATSRVAVELTDHLSRVRGTSQVDPDADSAAGRLKYPGDVWFLEWSTTPVQPSSESQYRRAIEDLRRYNTRLSEGNAVFERRGDNLMVTLDRVAADIGGSSAALFAKIDQTANKWLDFTADDLFYANKGRLYAYALLLEALGRDFEQLIRERGLERTWEEMIASFRAAGTMEPWIIINGALDSQFRPSHLANQGFLLLRARFQLYEVRDILLK